MDLNKIVSRANSLSEQFDEFSSKLSESIHQADDVTNQTTDIIEYVDKNIVQTADCENMPVVRYLDLINLNDLLTDFKYIRETLAYNSDIGKNILKVVKMDIVSNDTDQLADVINAFAELNRSITENLRLYIHAYKELTNIIINLEKTKRGEISSNPQQTVNVNIGSQEANSVIKSTAEVIAEITCDHKTP